MQSIYRQLEDQYRNLNNARYDDRFKEYVVSANRFYTPDMDGVKAVLLNGDLVIDSDVFAEDKAEYVKIQARELKKNH